MLFRIEWSGWIVLIKSEILIMTGMVLSVGTVLTNEKPPLLPYSAHNWTFSQRASSPIWASRARTRQRAARPQGEAPSPPLPTFASPLVCLSLVYFSRYPPNEELARELLEIRLENTKGFRVLLWMFLCSLNWKAPWDTEILFALVIKISSLKK